MAALNTDSNQLASLLRNFVAAQMVARFLVSLLFGFSLLAGGSALLAPERKRTASRNARAAYTSFVLGTVALLAECALTLIDPNPPMANVVTLGVGSVLGVLTLSLDRSRPEGIPELTFLSAAVIWLIAVVTPLLFPPAFKSFVTLTGLTGVHIFTAIAGEGLCVVAFCGSLLYLWQHRRLKNKVLGTNNIGTSLNVLDRIVERSSLSGLFLLTVSLISGVALAFAGADMSQVGLVKILWAIAVWVWYVVSIFGRSAWGWRGRLGARLSVSGSLLIFLALFGTVWRRF